MSVVDLVVAPCSHEAAKFAVMNWHYSKAMPKSKLVKFGAWENGEFIGVVIFSVGATPEIGKEFGLSMIQVCELVRVATKSHKAYTSCILAQSIKMLRKSNPGLRLIVSFADTAQNHHGGIYQATNWVFSGSKEYHAYVVLGETYHPRSLHHKFGLGGQSVAWLRANVDPNAKRITTMAKHRYLYPLDKAMRRQIEPLAQPYPKRADVGEMESRAGTTD